MTPADADVIAALDALREEVESCSRCVLHESRTRAVFGEGDPGADLMFVGEAPGYHEDQQGRPFVGQAGKLLEQLLASIQLTREQVYIANVLKSRPPNNRDPRPEEIEACQPYLWRQIALIKPRVICTLGNFATKLLSGNPAGITRVHGHPQVAEIGGHKTYLYPIFHPAAALYTPSMLTTLKEDFQRLPELLSHAVPQTEQAAAPPAAERPAWLPPQRRAAADTPSPAPEPAQADLLAQAAADPHGAGRGPAGAVRRRGARRGRDRAGTGRRRACCSRPDAGGTYGRTRRPARDGRARCSGAGRPARARRHARPRDAGRRRARSRCAGRRDAGFARQTGAARPLLSMLILTLASAAQTRRFARVLAALLSPPALVTVEGDLGTGKTTLVRELLHARGVRGAVTSPSFTLAQSYHGRDGEELHHLDLYRLSRGADVDLFAWDDYLGPRALTFVEWPAAGSEALPAADVRLELRHRTRRSRVARLCAAAAFEAAVGEAASAERIAVERVA